MPERSELTTCRKSRLPEKRPIPCNVIGMRSHDLSLFLEQLKVKIYDTVKVVTLGLNGEWTHGISFLRRRSHRRVGRRPNANAISGHDQHQRFLRANRYVELVLQKLHRESLESLNTNLLRSFRSSFRYRWKAAQLQCKLHSFFHLIHL